ncbi:hypothetical protein CSB67_3366 [Enterobacter hormaechei]|nr:hypothetical protein CSB67_3366 [Enterobacter hormaechei]
MHYHFLKIAFPKIKAKRMKNIVKIKNENAIKSARKTWLTG